MSWLIATILPRIEADETSAMYMGDIIEAMPTPIPSINRNVINTVRFANNGIAKVEIAKLAAPVTKDDLSPYFLEILPASKQPAIQRSVNTPVENPSQYSFTPDCSLKTARRRK